MFGRQSEKRSFIQIRQLSPRSCACVRVCRYVLWASSLTVSIVSFLKVLLAAEKNMNR